MKYNTLGHTGILVSELCLGTMTFSSAEGMWKSVAGVDQKLADELLRLALEAGINFVDTADIYTNGESEKTLAQAIANLGIARKDIVIATKAYEDTSWTPSKPRSNVSRPTTSTCIKSMGQTPSRPLKKRSARSTRSSRRARFATSAAPTGRPGRL